MSNMRKNKKVRQPGGKEGDTILFSRKGKKIYGVIQIIRENVAVVKINNSDYRFLNLPNELTVVAHGKYQKVN